LLKEIGGILPGVQRRLAFTRISGKLPWANAPP
jgi:hypothetical protein